MVEGVAESCEGEEEGGQEEPVPGEKECGEAKVATGAEKEEIESECRNEGQSGGGEWQGGECDGGIQAEIPEDEECEGIFDWGEFEGRERVVQGQLV